MKGPRGIGALVSVGALAALVACDAPARPATTPAGGAGGGGGGGGASGGGPGGEAGAPDLCGACSAPETLGTIASPAVDETSGLAASRLHEGVLYAHDDSGETARFFAIAGDGADRGTFELRGPGPDAPAAVDWEDMAAGPCADGAPGCLYFADVGDNDAVRTEVAILRVREPATLGAGLVATLDAESFSFRYPDGAHDVEAVVVHPTTGVITLFTKALRSGLYELRPPLAAGMVAVRVGEVEVPAFLPLVTGADVDPAATRLALRTYSDVVLFAIPPGGSAADAVRGPSCKAPVAAEAQGEAIAWLADGAAFITVSEGLSQELHRVACP